MLILSSHPQEMGIRLPNNDIATMVNEPILRALNIHTVVLRHLDDVELLAGPVHPKEVAKEQKNHVDDGPIHEGESDVDEQRPGFDWLPTALVPSGAVADTPPPPEPFALSRAALELWRRVHGNSKADRS